MGVRKLLLLNDHHHVFNIGCWVHEQHKIIEIISWYIVADFIVLSFWCTLKEMFCKEQLEISIQINTLKSDNDQWTIILWYLSYDALLKLHFKHFIKTCFTKYTKWTMKVVICFGIISTYHYKSNTYRHKCNTNTCYLF